MDQQGPIEWQVRMLRSWHLAILRFALTRDNADRLGVLAVANEIDRLAQPHNDQVDFDFFRRTSTQLCEAILQPDKTPAETVLQQYFAQIDDAQLKRALAAVIEVDQPGKASNSRRSKAYSAKWRGLLLRQNAQR